MMKKKKIIGLITSFLLLLLMSCSSEGHNSLIIDDEYTMVTYVELGTSDLLSIEYRITNHSKEDIELFYVKYVFHHKDIQGSLGLDEYSSYKIMGLTGTTLGPGETFQGGDNIEMSEETGDYLTLRDVITGSNAIEIQLIDTETEVVITSDWIHKINYVDEVGKK